LNIKKPLLKNKKRLALWLDPLSSPRIILQELAPYRRRNAPGLVVEVSQGLSLHLSG
jgi:hypothetical protein